MTRLPVPPGSRPRGCPSRCDGAGSEEIGSLTPGRPTWAPGVLRFGGFAQPRFTPQKLTNSPENSLRTSREKIVTRYRTHFGFPRCWRPVALAVFCLPESIPLRARRRVGRWGGGLLASAWFVRLLWFRVPLPGGRGSVWFGGWFGVHAVWFDVGAVWLGGISLERGNFHDAGFGF